MWSDRIFSGKNYIRGKQILIIEFRSSLRTVGLIGRQAGRQAVNYKDSPTCVDNNVLLLLSKQAEIFSINF